MRDALDRARAGDGPTLIEARTYRVAGHFYSDREDYHDQSEVAAWRERDPIEAFRSVLTEAGVAAAHLSAIETKVAEEVQAAFDQAREDPDPTGDDLDPGAVYAWRAPRPASPPLRP